MVSCPKCGAEAVEDGKFCSRCGTPLAPKTEKPPAQEKKRTHERETCFGERERERERDYLGLVSFGIFLLVVGFVFTEHPNIVSDLRIWIERMANGKSLVRPPEPLIASAILFFGLIGLSDFFMAGIRLMIAREGRRILSDILSGVALVAFAYLLSLYSDFALTWRMVLGLEVAICGLLVMLYGLARSMFPR